MEIPTWETLIQVGTQIPLVLIFIWFVLRIEKAAKEEREQMRMVHKEERVEWMSALSKLTGELHDIANQLRALGMLITAHDTKITELSTRLEDCLNAPHLTTKKQ